MRKKIAKKKLISKKRCIVHETELGCIIVEYGLMLVNYYLNELLNKSD